MSRTPTTQTRATGQVAAVVLAGGRGSRLGGADKALVQLAGRPLLAHVLARLRSQAAPIALNAAGDPARFAEFGLPVIADPVPGFLGPLAGVLAGLDWMREAAPEAPWLASVAADTPFLPRDLVARLRAAGEAAEAEVVCAASGGRTHFVAALWRPHLGPTMRAALVERGVRRVEAWIAGGRAVTVEFAAEFGDEPVDPFFNVNRPEDLAEAERLIAGAGA